VLASAGGAFESCHEFEPAPEALACAVVVFEDSVDGVQVGFQFEIDAVWMAAAVHQPVMLQARGFVR
jgi:hypothetical protein